MKSKVKFAALVLVIGLLGLVIIPSTVFGGGPKVYEYNIKIEIEIGRKSETIAPMFTAPGNKAGTRIVNTNGDPEVYMTFPDSKLEFVPPDDYYYPLTETYTEQRCFRWSPLEDCWLQQQEPVLLQSDWQPCERCSGEPKHLQTLNNTYWQFHHMGIRSNTLDCRFDLKYKYTNDRQSGLDIYQFSIYMEFVKTKTGENTYTYTSVGDSSINWTHYTEIKTKGKKIESQHLTYPSPGQPTITIIITEVPQS